MKILGVDCWDVIYHNPTGIPLRGAIEGLRKLVDSKAFDKIYIISKVDPISEVFSRVNFKVRNFCNKTGISRENIIFCRRYEDKAPLAEKLHITHFVDDHLKVLYYMNTVNHLYALNPRHRELKKYPELVSEVTIVKSWEELLPMLLG